MLVTLPELGGGLLLPRPCPSFDIPPIKDGWSCHAGRKSFRRLSQFPLPHFPHGIDACEPEKTEGQGSPQPGEGGSGNW